MQVLWYIDRFGLPPSYGRILYRLLAANGITPTTVKFMNLGAVLKGGLIESYGSRTAPTWKPARETEILDTMRSIQAEVQPSVVVLSSPESLARVGLPPEHCTLLKLRGSVYVIDGIPHLVILPMSAYARHVSHKDIANANYGHGDSEDFDRAMAAAMFESESEAKDTKPSPRLVRGTLAISGVALEDDLGGFDGSYFDQLAESTRDSSSESHVDRDADRATDTRPVDGTLDEDTVALDTAGDEGAVKDKYDSYWYEPVMVPVGQFAIERDVERLARILKDGAPKTPQPKRSICQTTQDFESAIAFLDDCWLIAVDVETIPHRKLPKTKKPTVSDGYYVMTLVTYTGINDEGEIRSFAIQLTTAKSSVAPLHPNLDERLQTIGHLNANPVRKTLHNGVYDAAWFIRYGVPLSNYAYDSMTMWWSAHPDLPKTLDFVSSILNPNHSYWKMGRNAESFYDHTLYGMQDTEVTLVCTLRLIQLLSETPASIRNFNDAHMRCLIGLGMGLEGLQIDHAVRDMLASKLHEAADAGLKRFQYIVADDEANPNSPAQMSHLFYTLLGAPPRNAKGRPIKRITKKSKPSTGSVVMRLMRGEHPLFERIIDSLKEAKEPSKQLSNVMGIEFLGDRFTTNLDGVGTTTTRFSSRSDAFGFGSNAQNIRKSYRQMMRADDGCLLLEVDFSASDDVFVSYESEDEKKIALVESGRDMHSANASEVFFTNWEYADVVAGKKNKDDAVIHPITGIRQITKKAVHGANYLMAGMTLLMSAGREAIIAAAQHLGYEDAATWTIPKLARFCETLDQRYRDHYTRFARTGRDSFYQDLLREMLSTGGFTTCFNYKQCFTSDLKDDATLRACAASVGQANTAGRVNMAMMELQFGVRTLRFRDGPAPDRDDVTRRVSEELNGCAMRMQTHDSLTFNLNMRHPRWREGAENVLRVMSRPLVCKGKEFAIGIEADVDINWAKTSHGINTVEDIGEWWESQR